MLLQLEEITFNHNTSSEVNDAINLRRNETQFVTLPEWRRGVTIKPEDSPAAYAIEETRGRTLTIRAGFSCAGFGGQSLQIRALDARLYPTESPGPRSPKRLHPASNVLGQVTARSLSPQAGVFVETFELEKVRIWDVGVGAQDIEWRWQYRVSAKGRWTDFAASTHRIYTLLCVPTAPWRQQPYSPFETQLPWVEVLDRACNWAAGARSQDAAATLVTRRVNDLGQGVVTYDGGPFYTDDCCFDCSAFLRLLWGEVGGGGRVNCHDCAAIVSTFANAVGCDLSQSCLCPVGRNSFGLNPHIQIGKPGWQTGFRFFHHGVAAEGACGEDNDVYDACLQVDGDDDPTKLTAQLPTNLRFGKVGESGYRARLVLPEDESVCVPHPEHCKRRRLGPANNNAEECGDRSLLEEANNFVQWGTDVAPGVGLFTLDFFFADYVLPDWRVVGLSEYRKAGETPSIQSFWERKAGDAGTVLRADVYEYDSWTAARAGVMTALTRFQSHDLTLRATPDLGDVIFADDGHASILFATGNLFLLLRNVGKVTSPLDDAARAINQAIRKPPPGLIVEADAATAFGFRQDGDVVLLERPAKDPLARRRLYQLFADGGEVSRHGEQLVYRPAAGLNTLEIFTADQSGNGTRQSLQLDVH